MREKGHQVERMGQTYRDADQVIIWLGEGDAYPRTRALFMQDGKNRWPLTLPEVDLGELVSIPWFSRVWAVQEYVLPQKVLFQLGSLPKSAQHVETVITRHGAYLDGEKALYDQWRSICLLFEYRKLVQKRKTNKADPRLTLVRTFLDLTRQRLCRDSRDRIYSILGMFDDIGIVPNYSLPPQQVYRDFVSKHLEAGDFAILHECCIGVANADEQSYVPFFGQSQSRTKYIPFVDPLGATYSAGLHHPSSVTVEDGASISIRGFSIDTVQRKLDFAEDFQIRLDSMGLVVPDLSETAQVPLHGTWGAIYQTTMGHLINDSIERAIWRKDYEEDRLAPHFAKAPYSHNSLFEILIRAIRTDLDADYDFVSVRGQIRTDAHLHRSRRQILAERSLFWTEQGYIGLGSRYLQPGDMIAIFDGDTTPFLLRQINPAGDIGHVYKILTLFTRFALVNVLMLIPERPTGDVVAPEHLYIPSSNVACVETGQCDIKIVFDDALTADGKLTARGVHFTELDEEHHITATEIILYAGVFESPALLERSGIGSSKVLAAADVPVLYELSGVGKNSQDHLNCGLPIETKDKISTRDEATRNPEEPKAALADQTSGRRESDPSRRTQYSLIQKVIKGPDEAIATAFMLHSQHHRDDDFFPEGTPSYEDGNFVTVVAMPVHPFSRRGSHITFSPSRPPEIKFNYLSHPIDT
ncbi:uncharacterized protein M421DRAFT_90947 [Didymella exigua CBS 183.55]|uniref:GMC oxidoreductase n=1 Tax=Didymella exigua CBS 183.55 TaxID=1150837 RepID=A0A6A5RRJ9_9PLEO|nr:uncharacterized protein M421DRAFT_90947 [Didymella exigua CBS 183.55]KAF1930402.1 hypothetical protein M421DRAFT_90947 [Didymella exigua CBS 183.55]